ncbi:hypothetical protein ABZ499_00375 [Streptomyces sp. NPDC019990]|uniref:hypothetical protein n=1 Tax=Streptomyces sp. NPDC019990 TaxID=3154693 RepID=UPI0033E67C13
MADRCLGLTTTGPGRFLTRRSCLPPPAAPARRSADHHPSAAQQTLEGSTRSFGKGRGA